MSCVRSWHLWRCDAEGCGKQEKLEHGELAEAAIPSGWYATIGWGLHACSAAHRDLINAQHKAKTGKVYLFIEWKQRAA
jgi:hypothetical protein